MNDSYDNNVLNIIILHSLKNKNIYPFMTIIKLIKNLDYVSLY